MPAASLTSELYPLPDQEELTAIYHQIRPYIRETPLLDSPTLNKWVSGQVLIKPESLQITGAFKFRGALYRLMQLSKSEQVRGVAAYSSGNFARGLAHAGRILNIPVHLVMPHDAPVNKIEGVRRLGASITLSHDDLPSREEAASAMAAELADSNGHVLLHPFDDPILVQGQATVGIELKHQLDKSGFFCDALLCPSGGGSLVAGCSLSFSPEVNNKTIYAVESKDYEGMGLSLNNQKITRATGGTRSDCDALLALTPGRATFAIASATGVKGLTVSDHYVKKALRLAFEELHLVLEPSGAIALAAILAFPDLFRGKQLVAIATGGNIDIATFRMLLD